ncbi:MAG TPA: hypothetical protein O0X25_01775 [Methanocorpusculum sp.]|nr:hypothetical protein [Methanocorpusculum sp.]HJJ39726.1 hypothetical protein [Methanocorpusculum sp.]HJJ49335.1 hypothetical protein [Methanocorpusculum sp.]HJJ56621.1 hypothetical protein [Methanocorpusculum sp.]
MTQETATDPLVAELVRDPEFRKLVKELFAEFGRSEMSGKTFDFGEGE